MYILFFQKSTKYDDLLMVKSYGIILSPVQVQTSFSYGTKTELSIAKFMENKKHDFLQIGRIYCQLPAGELLGTLCWTQSLTPFTPGVDPGFG